MKAEGHANEEPVTIVRRFMKEVRREKDGERNWMNSFLTHLLSFHENKIIK